MADEENEAEVEADVADGAEGTEGEAEEGGKRKLSGKFIVLFVALPLLVLGGGGGGAAYYLGLFGGSPEENNGEMAAVEPEKTRYYYNLPEFLVNLNSRKRNAQFLKLMVALEYTNSDVKEALEPLMPRIHDAFQVYLRELRSEDLEGSAGVYRLKGELLKRINLEISPKRVERVLFREILVQ